MPEKMVKIFSKTLILMLLAVFIFCQQSMPGVALPAFRSTKPPSSPTELLASSMEDSKIRLTWTLSTSSDVGVYNIYTDNGGGAIDYNIPIATVDHKTNLFVTPPLKSGISYRFGVRAVSTSDIEEKNSSIIASASASENISKVTTGSENIQRLREVTGEAEVSIIADVIIGDMEERRVGKEKENIDDISLRLKDKKKKIEEMKKEMKEINGKLLNDRKDIDSIRDELSLDREMLLSPDKENANKNERKKSAGNLAEHFEKLADKEREVTKMIAELMNIKSRSESKEIVSDAKELLKEAKSRITQVQAVVKDIKEEKENLEKLKNKVAKMYPEFEEVIFSKDMSESTLTKKTGKVLDVKGAKAKLQDASDTAELLVEKVEEVRKKITETGAAVLNVVKEKELFPEEVKELKEIYVNTSEGQLNKLEEVRKKILEEKSVIYVLNSREKQGNKYLNPEEVLKSSGNIIGLSEKLKEIEKQVAMQYREAAAKKSAFEEKPASDKKSEAVISLGQLQKELKDVEIKRSEITRKRNSLVALEESIKSSVEKAEKDKENIKTADKINLPPASGTSAAVDDAKRIPVTTAMFPKKEAKSPAGIAGVDESTNSLKEPEDNKVPGVQPETGADVIAGKSGVAKAEENLAEKDAARENRTVKAETQVKKPEEKGMTVKTAEEEESVIQIGLQGPSDFESIPEMTKEKNMEGRGNAGSSSGAAFVSKGFKNEKEVTGSKGEDIRDAINRIDKLVEKLDLVGREIAGRIMEAIKRKEVAAEVAEKKTLQVETPAKDTLQEGTAEAKTVNEPAKNDMQGDIPALPELSVKSGETVSTREHLDSIGSDLNKILTEKKGAIDETTKMAKDLSITDIKKEKNVGVDDKATEVAIRLSEGAINFDYNKAEVKTLYFKLLNKIVKYIALNPDSKIRVEGHTCYVGSADYNKILSRKRAEAVVDYFVKHGHLHEGSFTVAGLGKDKPIAPNETEEGRSKNRRVEIIIEK